MGTKKSLLIAAVILIAIGLWIYTRSSNTSISSQTSTKQENNLTPVDSITHGHGLAVDVEDSNKVYIATHHGLLLLVNDQELFRVGKSEDDFMGFSTHPADANILYSSGHPKFGGNIGVQKSEDGGITWKKISNGLSGPVDFHAMTVSSANPDILYGWYQGRLQRSQDGGETWEIASTNISGVISLVSDSQDENVVYAATDQGLQRSGDKGSSWATIAPDLEGGAVIAFAVSPDNPEEMLSFSQKLGLAKSEDAGETWEQLSETFDGDVALYFAYSKQNPQIIYSLTRNNTVYKSTDSGITWTKVY